MNREKANAMQRKYRETRLAQGWKSFATLLPAEVFDDMKKYKQLRMAEWTLRQLKKG